MKRLWTASFALYSTGWVLLMLLGFIKTGQALIFPVIWQADPVIVVPIALVTVTAATLALLGCIKGAWIGLMWANGAGATRQ